MAATYGVTAQPSRAGLKENTSGQGTPALKASLAGKFDGV